MPTKKSVSNLTYPQLLKSIQNTVIESRNAIERTYVSMYWSIGRLIDEYIKENGNRMADGTLMIARLSEDIKVDQRTLYQTRDVYRAYPRIDASLPLSWSHYRYLAQLDTDQERKRWEKKIVQQSLSVSAFKQQLQLTHTVQKPISSKKLSPKRGLLYHYRLIKVSSANKVKDQIVIDCGFSNHIDVPKADFKLSNTRIVHSVKEKDSYAVKLSKATVKDIYTYRATVKRVVDGDTILAYIDCGFGIKREERLRLKGIDAPEINTLAGQRAKAFLEEELKRVAFIILKSYWEDPFARYVADVFFDPKIKDPQTVADQGIHLNQMLLDQGMAKRY